MLTPSTMRPSALHIMSSKKEPDTHIANTSATLANAVLSAICFILVFFLKPLIANLY
jgi:hypothetical protein